MSKYLLEVTYKGDLAKGLLAEGGTARRAEVESAIKGVDGTVEYFYYGFGNADAILIVDLPDHASAATMALMAKTAGFTYTTTVLLTPAELDAAAQKSPVYRPPGQ